MRYRIVLEFDLLKDLDATDTAWECGKAGVSADPADWNAADFFVADSHGFIDDPEVIEVKW